jgi:hypothetical protein
MAIPRMPWYSRVERIVAPTETASDVALVLILAVTLWVLIRGNAAIKAAWTVYVVSP